VFIVLKPIRSTAEEKKKLKKYTDDCGNKFTSIVAGNGLL
jgi:hypothetical protein